MFPHNGIKRSAGALLELTGAIQACGGRLAPSRHHPSQPSAASRIA
jgi:hypothetical protein